MIDTPQTGGLYNATEKPQLISKQFSFTEGASVDGKGNVFFTDQPNNQIWEYSIDGKLSLWMDNTLRSNGTYFDPVKNACAQSCSSGYYPDAFYPECKYANVSRVFDHH